MEYQRSCCARGIYFFRDALKGNVFAIECFLDELAEHSGVDPLYYRLGLLSDPRARAVLERAAKMAGWGQSISADNTGRGLAFARATKGVRLVGDLPQPHGLTTTYTADVVIGSKINNAARDLIAALTSIHNADLRRQKAFG